MKNIVPAMVVLVTMVGGAAALMLPAAGTYDLDTGDNEGHWWEATSGETIFSDVPQGEEAQWYYGFELFEGTVTDDFLYAGSNPVHAGMYGSLIEYNPGRVFLSVTGQGGSEAFELDDIAAWSWIPDSDPYAYFELLVVGTITGDDGTADVTIRGEGRHADVGTDYGTLANVKADVAAVPDGGATLALLGLAVVALGASRRA